MSQNVLITGAGKAVGLGFNLALRYLERGDTVVATIRRPCAELESLADSPEYKDRLIILYMDISDSSSVNKAAEELTGRIDHLDLLINNAVSVSRDCDLGFFDADLDLIAHTVDVIAVGAMRVIKAFYPLLKRGSEISGPSLIINISSEAGSITRCYRTAQLDYGMAKASMNMVTMNLYNTFKERGDNINIFSVHPGWIRTDGRADNPAPLSSYEAAGILTDLFEERRGDLTGHRFITNEGEDYPF
ncbi:MAG: SDR family NAD(P)-dependent oxidoreductase [Clostridiales bacterium]|nr:SDR family NAD(P)-dependent oxidoreductase [Clostridiales bacterium]